LLSPVGLGSIVRRMDELSEEQLERALQASESSAKPEAPFCVECQRGFQDG